MSCPQFFDESSGDVYFPKWRDTPLPDNQCPLPTPMLLKNYNTRENDYYIHHFM